MRRNEDAEAVSLAAPIIQGRLRCGSIPKITFGNLLLPLVRLGRLDEAVSLHLQGYRLIARGSKGYISSVADHFTFLNVTENFDRAPRDYSRSTSRTRLARRLATKFDYYQRCLVFARYLKRARLQSFKTTFATHARSL